MTPGVIAAQIAGPWHVIALQEVADDVDDTLQQRFHVRHFTVCAMLINRNAFEGEVQTRHLFILANTGYADWTLESIVSRARLTRPVPGGRSHFSVMNAHVTTTVRSEGPSA